MKQTRRLYHEDPELRSFTAEVLEIRPAPDGMVDVLLDQTAFFPTGGGQPHDTGNLAGASIVDVFEDGKRVIHRVRGVVPEGSVTGEVEWVRRVDHRQQHTGQHILSRAIWDLSGGNTVGFHLGSNTCNIDLDTKEDSDSLATAEARSNEVVLADTPILDHRYPGPDQLPSTIRKETSVEGEIRVIAIGDFDATPCCGTHCSRSGQVGPIKILRWERRRGGTRVEFVCGTRALEDYRNRHRALREAALAFTTEDLKVPERIRALQQERKSLSNKLEKTEQELRGQLVLEWGSIGGNDLLVREIGEGRSSWLAPMSKALVARRNAPVFLYTYEGNEARVVLAAPAVADLNAGEFLDNLLTKHEGRGGGTNLVAQGRIPKKMIPGVVDTIKNIQDGFGRSEPGASGERNSGT